MGDSYMKWDREVLEYCWAKQTRIDYISLHRYVGNWHGETENYLAVTNAIDKQIEDADAVCRYVQASTKSRQRSRLCFDEWNVWYKTQNTQHMDGAGKRAPHICEEEYNLEDAIVVAGFLHSFLRHADVVRIANIAQVVNVIAPILTVGDKLLQQSIYYPFAAIARRAQGGNIVSLAAMVDGPGYKSKKYGPAKYIDAAAVLRDDTDLSVFAANRSLDAQHNLRIQVADRGVVSVLSAELVTGPGPKAANSFAAPRTVASEDFTGHVRLLSIGSGGVGNVSALLPMPPLSFVALTLRLAPTSVL